VDRDRLRYRSDTDATRRAGGPHLGIGAAQALAKLTAAMILTGLAVASFVLRWNPFLIIVIGLAWAIVFAGLIVVPIVAGRVADTLSQYGRKAPQLPRERDGAQGGGDSWDGVERRRPQATPDIGLQLPPTRGLMARPDVLETVPGFNWTGLVEGVADRLEGALGEGFTAQADFPALVLRHGEMVRRVNLGLIFQPPPLDVGERALRGCLKMMDEAQMFSMRVRQTTWPDRGDDRDRAPGDLARPRVRLEEGEIRMAWADNGGTLLRLPPLPFGGPSPGSRDSNW